MTTLDNYKNELRRMRPVLEYIAAFDIDRAVAEWTDDDVRHFDNVLNRYGQVLDIVEAIEAEIPAQKMKLRDLLTATARHLCGRDVEVRIEQPRDGHAGMCQWIGDAVKIQINPSAVADGEKLLDVFLHECAHARLHRMAGEDAERAEQMENEATRQARVWQHYAKTHSAPREFMPDVGGENPAANYLRLQLLTLLDSDEVLRRTIQTA